MFEISWHICTYNLDEQLYVINLRFQKSSNNITYLFVCGRLKLVYWLDQPIFIAFKISQYLATAFIKIRIK